MIKKLYVDLSVLGTGTTGVSVYGIQLAHELTKHFDCTVVLPDCWSDGFSNVVHSPAPLYFKGSFVSRRPLWRQRSKVSYDKEAFVYAPHMRGFLDVANQAVTVHDLIAHYHPTRNHIENLYNARVLPHVVRRSKLLLTVSESSREVIADYYRMPFEKIAVVPNGIDLDRWTPLETQTLGSEDPYLLVVSANRPYKNTLELLDNSDLWVDRYRLKIVSSKARYGVLLRAKVQELGLESTVDFIDGIPEPRLIELYQNAAAVVYPSLIEGFGRPALEGMAVGTPVILSDIPPHVEIFSGAAIYVTPGNKESWERAFDQLTVDVVNRRERGLAIAARHSWFNCGIQLRDALLQTEPALQALQKTM
jgi:glycosyltransferase involved in cell wall biosynthesis